MSGPGEPRLTRRSVLGGAAAAGAASLIAPAADVAAAFAGNPPRVFSRWVGDLAGASGAVSAPRPFAMLGVEWAGPRGPRIELRTRAPGARWSPWARASTLGHGPDRPGDGGKLFGEPIWTGPADQVQVRSSAPVKGLRLHFVAASARASGIAGAAAVLPLARPVLDAGPGQPTILAREAWAGGRAPPSGGPAFGTVKLAFVHHTVSPNGYGPSEVPAMLLSIFDYHRFVRGFFDIAYNFIVDAYGRVWEARAGGIDKPVVGAQAGGYNQESTGVAVLGTFMAVVPPPAAIAALERLLAWKLSLHGLRARGRVTVVVAAYDAFYTPFPPLAHVSLPRVAGHRDGDSTDCPGNAFYAQLPAIRQRVSALAGSPARLTAAGPSGTSLAGEPIALAGRVRRLSGGPIAGAPIEVQQLIGGGQRTAARATAAADGSWAASVLSNFNLTVRALHRPAPAAVSELVEIGVAPAISFSVAPSPLRVSGDVLPPKRSVTIELYSLRGGHRRLVARKRVAVRRGAFAARIASRRAGRYAVRVWTAADERNAPGASELPVSIA
jgi:N-acetylmuramoyl-L-alanine amidase